METLKLNPLKHPGGHASDEEMVGYAKVGLGDRRTELK